MDTEELHKELEECLAEFARLESLVSHYESTLKVLHSAGDFLNEKIGFLKYEIRQAKEAQ